MLLDWMSAGRLRTMLLDCMFDKKSKWKYENVKQMAQDKDAWYDGVPDLLDSRELEKRRILC